MSTNTQNRELLLDRIVDLKTPLFETVTRQQIAEMACVPKYKVMMAATLVRLKFPQPVGKQSRELLYDRTAVEDWLAKNDLKKMPIYSQRYSSSHDRRQTRLIGHPHLDQELALAFIRGAYAPLAIRKQHWRRCRRAQRNQAATQCVHVKEAPCEREAPRRDLDVHSGPERPSLASLSGSGRQFY
ncbi:hypothetical protein [Methylobacter marinus]|uniref:hypothetical protein n=1 Tax=Methylobacter marinus TaxID=34058 RepID=UPI00035EF997|nr:hypothetical protein [Methylobacter marinus]